MSDDEEEEVGMQDDGLEDAGGQAYTNHDAFASGRRARRAINSPPWEHFRVVRVPRVNESGSADAAAIT